MKVGWELSGLAELGAFKQVKKTCMAMLEVYCMCDGMSLECAYVKEAFRE